MYLIIDSNIVIYKSEFLDDIEAWFDKNDPGRGRYALEFESLDD